MEWVLILSSLFLAIGGAGLAYTNYTTQKDMDRLRRICSKCDGVGYLPKGE